MTRRKRDIARWLSLLAAFSFLGIALMALVRELRPLSPTQIENAVAAVSGRDILISLGLTGVSFAMLGFYDLLATRLVAPMRVPAWLAWFAGVAANAVANTLGFHAVTGTAVRYHLYRAAGLGLPDVARVISLSWATLAFGFASIFAATLLLAPHVGPVARAGGLTLFIAMGVFLIWLGPGGRQFVWTGFSLSLPSWRLAGLQMAISAVEMGAAIGALYLLMPTDAIPHLLAFAAAYIGAVLLGIVSHAPGGIGVFEAVMLSLAGGHDRAGVLVALLLYRLFYNLLPFVLTTIALLVFEGAGWRRVSWISDSAQSALPDAHKVLPA